MRKKRKEFEEQEMMRRNQTWSDAFVVTCVVRERERERERRGRSAQVMINRVRHMRLPSNTA